MFFSLVYTVNMKETTSGLGSQGNHEQQEREVKKYMNVSDFWEEQVARNWMEKGKANRKSEKKIQNKG